MYISIAVPRMYIYKYKITSVYFCAALCWATSLSWIRRDVLKSGFLCYFFLKIFIFAKSQSFSHQFCIRIFEKYQSRGKKSYGRSFDCVKWETTDFRLNGFFSLCLCFRNCNVCIYILHTEKIHCSFFFFPWTGELTLFLQ